MKKPSSSATRKKAAKPAAVRSLASAVTPLIAGARPGPASAELLAEAEAAGAGKAFDRLAKSNPQLLAFLDGVAAASPFLRSLMLADLPRLADLLAADPSARAEKLVASIRAGRPADEAELMRTLRHARAELALIVGLADLGGVFAVAEVTRHLSAFATAAVGAAASFLLREEAAAGRLRPLDAKHPEVGSGWIILGMGKLGAAELNYSSDIDLIVFFERETAPLAADVEPGGFFVRITRRLVHLLQEHTEDGYVFRVDLRLRPDPGSTPIAVSTLAALQYYESQGQNWERAAMIKAEPVAGDIAAGRALLAELGPYVWRKYLDYAAIADIHSIKRQIHDHRGHGEIAVAGHNIKLGRGGIREIEFFVQTQQLIAGGREPQLRGRRTVDMLAALAEAKWIGSDAAEQLAESYEALRRIEHRLQMVADEQTHTLPEEPVALANIARMCGFRNAAAFGKALVPVLETVRSHYQRLFEAAPALGTAIGSLVFTGDDEDPDTLATLARLGFSRPSDVIRQVRAWHFGRYPSMRSATARERLTEITPALLQALAGTANADVAFAAFDRFLARLPAGVQLFSMLGSNTGLLDLIATIMGAAPRLAAAIERRPHVLDALIEPAFFGVLPERETLSRRLEASLAEAAGFEDALDRARIFGQEQDFLIGVRLMAGAVTPRAAGRAYSDLAELLIAALAERVREAFEAAHGRLPGGKFTVLALGKLGGREMSAASDLDLILLYDTNAGAVASDGPRSLSAGQYYARLTQRLVAALSVPTAEGTLYEVDFRLRPSGNAGPLATSFKAFAEYQSKEAWTWEHMALTRARPVAGDPKLGARAATAIRKVLANNRDRARTVADILEMRAMVEGEKGEGGHWDIKQSPGGLVDIEFVAQALQLLHGAKHPQLLSTETEASLTAAAARGVLPPAEAEVLLPALRLYQGLTALIRLCIAGPFDPAEAPKAFLDLLARSAGQPDFKRLDVQLRETQRAVRRAFERILGKVAAAKS